MQKDMTFLSNTGLTKTSANHIKDMAGHYIDLIREEISSINLTNSTVSLLGSEPSELSKGWTVEHLEKLDSQLYSIIKAQSLQAWLGEAIKALSRLQSELNNFTIEDYAKLKGIEIKSVPPVLYEPSKMSEDEWLATLSVKERSEYLALQAACAVVGKFIHPKGPYAEARKAAQSHLSEPRVCQANGRDTLIYTYEPSVALEEIDNKFFELQALHRSYQARFNALKHKFDIAAAEKSTKDIASYREAFVKRDIEAERVYAANMKIAADYKAYVAEEQEKLDELKIIIPNELRDIYDVVNKLGK